MACKRKKRKAKRKPRQRKGDGFGTPIVRTAVGGALAITVVRGVMG